MNIAENDVNVEPKILHDHDMENIFYGPIKPSNMDGHCHGVVCNAY